MSNRTIAQSLAFRLNRTRLVHMSAGALDLVLWVKRDEELDDQFLGTCAETGDCLRVNGWLWELHDGAEDRAELVADFGFDWRDLNHIATTEAA